MADSIYEQEIILPLTQMPNYLSKRITPQRDETKLNRAPHRGELAPAHDPARSGEEHLDDPGLDRSERRPTGAPPQDVELVELGQRCVHQR